MMGSYSFNTFIRRHIIWFGIQIVTLLFLSGCSGFSLKPTPDVTRHYVLSIPESDFESESEPTAQGYVIGLERIQVPAFLETRRIATRLAGNEMRYSEVHRWSESLEDGIARVLAELLSREPSISKVVSAPWADNSRIDAFLAIRITRFEGTESGTLRLEASWDLRTTSDNNQIVSERFEWQDVGWNITDYDALAHGLSAGIGDLAEDLASHIADLPKQQGQQDRADQSTRPQDDEIVHEND